MKLILHADYRMKPVFNLIWGPINVFLKKNKRQRFCVQSIFFGCSNLVPYQIVGRFLSFVL